MDLAELIGLQREKY